MPKGKAKPVRVWSLAVHGGAGADPSTDHSAAEAHMAALLKAGAGRLEAGESAIDVVVEMVRQLEDSGFHVAGKGAAPNDAGEFELDSAVMDGETRAAGAVAALQGVRNPVLAAQAVMRAGRHVLLVGEGARRFCSEAGLETVPDPRAYHTPAASALSLDGRVRNHGTVGAVALDSDGNLAAATSTGGTLGKRAGRVGDTPLIGAGTWADERAAVSCTGSGEYFIKTNAAADVSARIRYNRESLATACQGVLADVSFLGGDGGLIAVDRLGAVAMPFNTAGMKRGCVTSSGQFDVRTGS